MGKEAKSIEPKWDVLKNLYLPKTNWKKKMPIKVGLLT